MITNDYGKAITITDDGDVRGVLIDGTDDVLDPNGGIWLATTDDVRFVRDTLTSILRERILSQRP